jgi:hypothetical protein
MRGTVVDNASGIGVAGVYVALLTPADSVIESTFTDRAGGFTLNVQTAGHYRLRTGSIGYLATTTNPIEVGSTDTGPVMLRIPLDPVVVDSLTVAVEARVPHLEQSGFYRRMQLGSGHFITRDQFARRTDSRIMDLLRGLPGVRILGGDPITGGDVAMRGGASSKCRPIFAVDGDVVRRGDGSGGLEVLPHPNDIEAIEVYTGPKVLPAQVAGGGTSPCGAVLVWTRR